MIFKSLSDNQTDQKDTSGDQETIPSPEETPTPEESQNDEFVHSAQENIENDHSSSSDPEQIEVDQQEESGDQQEEIGQNTQNESDFNQNNNSENIDTAVDQEPAALETESPEMPAKEDKQQVEQTETETIYQMVYVDSNQDPAASGTLEYSAESYYLLTVICSVLLFFFLVCVCKYIYKFFNMFF